MLVFWVFNSGYLILNDSAYAEYDYYNTGDTNPVTETLVAGEGRTHEPKYMIDYQTDITVYGLDEYDNKVIQFI